MIQSRGVELLVEQRQQELIRAAGPAGSRRLGPESQQGAAQRSVAGPPVAGDRAVRRAVAPRFGAWLIAFGTRLGGATIRTSS
jgi:hypothetical protein